MRKGSLEPGGLVWGRWVHARVCISTVLRTLHSGTGQKRKPETETHRNTAKIALKVYDHINTPDAQRKAVKHAKNGYFSRFSIGTVYNNTSI